MTKEQTRKFLDAVESAEIKYYEFDTDLGTHLYNNKEAILKFVEADEMVYNIRSNAYGGSTNTYGDRYQIVAAWTEDIHEARTSGTLDQITNFINAIGSSFTDDDIKILTNINQSTYDINPETGDYNRFVKLSKKEYDALTPEKKEEYDAKYAEEEKKKANYLPSGVSARITINQ